MIDHSIETELSRAGSSVFDALAAQARSAGVVAATIAGEPGVGDLLAAGNREELVRRYVHALPALSSEANIQFVVFTKAPAIVVARVQDPGAFGDDISQRRKMVVEAIRQGKTMTGIEPGRSDFTTFATVPLVTANGVAGVVDIGTPLNSAYLERLKRTHNVDLAIQVDAGDHFQTQNATFAAKTLLTPEEARAAFDGRFLQKIVSQGGKSLAVTALPIKDFSGRKIGLVEVADDVTAIIHEGRVSLWATIAGSALIAALSLVLFVVFAVSLSRPIRALTLSMNRLASGDLQSPIEGQGRPDEIGAMAAAVQVFKQNAMALEQATAERARVEASSDTERRRNEAERQYLARQQEDVVLALAASLERLSAGDLTSHIDAAFAPEYEKLRQDFNRAVARLRETMTVIVKTAQGIRSGTGEIAQAADDLSRRTEQQAASLEETAAALDQITATVRKSAEGAIHARQVVTAADEDAKQSALIVIDAVQAMDGIARSAQQISQIIGVIDEIAFQTNLLALNAGVEAARAGDAGRGFAVVASEVRALAQRSAEAAKEIKGLISTSTAQVDHGVRLVAETGKALERIMSQVSGITRVVDDIASGAREQATGLAEVNVAINKMDQVTQQNAAMVEQSTAASHSLSLETTQLSSLISQFQIGPKTDDQVLREELRKVAPHAFRQPAKRNAADARSRS
jgi:methyl-accepting chemotaxis protein